jgi:hypothetical protein
MKPKNLPSIEKTNYFKLFLLSICLIVISNLNLCGQSLEVDEVDEFTKNRVKKTTYETLHTSMKFSAFCRISNINGSEFFELKMMIGAKVFSINKDQELMLKLDNEEIITIKNLEYAITCTGCGAKGFGGSTGQGIKTSYFLSKEQHEKLKTNKVVKLRIYTSDGYVEGEVKEKNYLFLKNALSLVE